MALLCQWVALGWSMFCPIGLMLSVGVSVEIRIRWESTNGHATWNRTRVQGRRPLPLSHWLSLDKFMCMYVIGYSCLLLANSDCFDVVTGSGVRTQLKWVQSTKHSTLYVEYSSLSFTLATMESNAKVASLLANEAVVKMCHLYRWSCRFALTLNRVSSAVSSRS